MGNSVVLLGIAMGSLHSGVGSTNRSTVASARSGVDNCGSDVHRNGPTAALSATIHQAIAIRCRRDRPLVDAIALRGVHRNVLGCLGFAVKCCQPIKRLS